MHFKKPWQLADGFLHGVIYGEGPLLEVHAHPAPPAPPHPTQAHPSEKQRRTQAPSSSPSARLPRQAIWFPPFSLVILPFIYLFIVLPRTKCRVLFHRLIWMIEKSFLFSDRLTQKPWEEEKKKKERKTKQDLNVIVVLCDFKAWEKFQNKTVIQKISKSNETFIFDSNFLACEFCFCCILSVQP